MTASMRCYGSDAPSDFAAPTVGVQPLIIAVLEAQVRGVGQPRLGVSRQGASRSYGTLTSWRVVRRAG